MARFQRPSIPPQPLGSNIILLADVTSAVPFFNINLVAVKSTTLVAPDQLHTSIASFTNPIPFGSFDWSKPANQKPQSYPPAYNLALLSVQVVAAPFYQDDWSVTTRLKIGTPGQISRNPLIFSEVPFDQLDWSKPSKPTAEKPLPPPNIIALLSGVPFAQYDWSKPQQLQGALYSAPQPYNQGIYTNPIPFAPYNWGTVSRQTSTTALQPFNINLSAVIQSPFFLTDWSTGIRLRVSSSDQIGRNPNIFSEVPFYSQDWSKTQQPYFSVARSSDFNLNLYTVVVTAPFNQTDWSRTKWPESASSDIYYNQNLYSVVISNPFFPIDLSGSSWPKRTLTPDVVYNQNIFTNPIPFGPYDYPRTVNVRSTPFDINGLPNAVLANFSTPFVSYDWSKVKAVKASIDPQYPDLIILQPVGSPFYQLDWSKGFTIPPKASNQNDVPNILLIQPSVPSNGLGIFGWIDWSSSQGKNNFPKDFLAPNLAIILPAPPPPPDELLSGWRENKYLWPNQHHKDKSWPQWGTEKGVQEAAAILSSLGGLARAKSLTSKERSTIASNAAKTRWDK